MGAKSHLKLHALFLLIGLLIGFAVMPVIRRIAAANAPAAISQTHCRHLAFRERSRLGGPGCRVLFLGDSITDFWRDQAVWDSDLAPSGAVNFGAAWETSAGLMGRLSAGELHGLSPEVIVLMIGTNDFGLSATPPHHTTVANHILSIVGFLKSNQPDAKLVLMAILPRGDKPHLNAHIAATNNILASTDGLFFIDLSKHFGDGQDATLMPDKVHLSPDAYRIWLDALKPHLPR